MERLRIRRQHVGTRKESGTLSLSDRRIQQETFITEMNSASSEKTRLHLYILYIINISLSFEPSSCPHLEPTPSIPDLPHIHLSPVVISPVIASSLMNTSILMIALPLTSIILPLDLILESLSQTRAIYIPQTLVNDHKRKNINIRWVMNGKLKSAYELDDVSVTTDHLPSDDQSSDTMIYPTGIVLPLPPLHTMQLTRIHLSRMHGMALIQTTHRSGRYSRNVSVTVKEKRKGLMSSSRWTGAIGVKIPVRSLFGSSKPSTTRRVTTSLIRWRSCTCLTSAGTSTIEKALCEISFFFFFPFPFLLFLM